MTLLWILLRLSSVQFSRSVVSDSLQPHDRSTPGLPVHCQLRSLLKLLSQWCHPPSHPLLSPSPPDVSLTVGSRDILKYCYNWNIQFSSVSQSCPTLWDPMNRSTSALPVHHQLPEFTKTHIHRVSDAIQPSHPLSSLSPPAPNPSQHQNLFLWVNSSHEVVKVLEFQL